MSTKKTTRHDRARATFSRTGVSIAEWAQTHGFSRSLVYAVLAGRKPGHRGQSHRIAVLLGLKPGGEITDGPAAVTRQLKASTHKEAA